ncbi:MAG: glycosyltransferase family 2 protein [Patescibacteria group bacterium]
MGQKYFVSICIPSYDRPHTLYRLLKTIDVQNAGEVEVVICEDFSSKRNEIREQVENFKKETEYAVVYKENEENLGYDKNLKELIRNASGKWIVFMGDDDVFTTGALDKFIPFLKQYNELGYVLRAHDTVHENGQIEKFRYYAGEKFFEPGAETFAELLRKSVFISGFTIKRDLVLPYLGVGDFDATALFQIYLLGEVIMKHKSAYFDESLTREIEKRDYRKDEKYFDHKTKKFIPRQITLDVSISFLSGYVKITEFIDKKYGINSIGLFKKDMSKYFYPSLSVHRDKGLKTFLRYVKMINKLGFNITFYYYLYIFFLAVFGRKICDYGITMIKKILNKTPKL